VRLGAAGDKAAAMEIEHQAAAVARAHPFAADGAKLAGGEIHRRGRAEALEQRLIARPHILDPRRELGEVLILRPKRHGKPKHPFVVSLPNKMGRPYGRPFFD